MVFPFLRACDHEIASRDDATLGSTWASVNYKPAHGLIYLVWDLNTKGFRPFVLHF